MSIFSQDKLNKFEELLQELRHSMNADKLVEALSSIPIVVKEIVSNEVKNESDKLRGNIKELSGEVKRIWGELHEIRDHLEKIEDNIVDIEKRLDELNRNFSRLEINIGGLTEATLAKFLIEELEQEGYNVIEAKRNVLINDEDIDLIIIAERDGKKEYFIVEIKVKPKHSDVGILLSKSDLYEARTGVKPKPISAGIWIGKEIESYCREKGVVVYKF